MNTESNNVTDTDAVTGMADVLATPATSVAEVTSTSQVTAIIPHSELVRNLMWVDIHQDEPVMGMRLAFLNVGLQEKAGLYWECASPEELEELGVTAGEPIMQVVRVFDAKDERLVTCDTSITPCGDQGFVAIWDARGSDGLFVPAGSYYFEVESRVGLYVNQDGRSEPIEVIGDAYTVFLAFSPKDDKDLEAAIKQADPSDHLPINAKGQRIIRDSWLEVYRGGTPGMPGCEAVTHRIDAHLEATWPGYFSAPKNTSQTPCYKGCYKNYKKKRWGEHSVIGFGDRVDNNYSAPGRTAWSEFRQQYSWVTIEAQNPQPALPNQHYRDGIWVHKADRTWDNTGVSQGCVTIPVAVDKYRMNTRYPANEADPPYGKGLIEEKYRYTPAARITHEFGAFHNRQTSTNFLSENSDDILATVFGNFTIRDICDRLKIYVQLRPAVPGSAYDRLHRYPVVIWDADCSNIGRDVVFSCRFRTAETVLRELRTGEDLVVEVDRSHVKFVPYIRYTSEAESSGTGLILDHKLDSEQHPSHVENDRYTLLVFLNTLDESLEAAVLNGQASVLLKVNFAWRWRNLVANYPHLPPAGDQGLYWDMDFEGPGKVNVEFDFAIPAYAATGPE